MKQTDTPAHLPQACPQWAEKLNAIHRDDLPFEERAQLRKHLETCANCQAVKAEYRALDALITGLPPVEPLSAMPARLRELTARSAEGVSSREPAGMGKKVARLLPTEDVYETSPQTHRQQPQARLRRRLVGLNMAAAVLVVAALVAGFVILRPSHPSASGSSHGAANTSHPHAPLQHTTYLDVIIGNGHGDSYAVDPQSGNIVWKHQVMTEPANNPFSADGILYYSGVNNVLYAIDGGDGQPLWHVQLAPNNQNDGIGWNLAATNDLVFATIHEGNTSTIYALNAYTGAIVWQKKARTSQGWAILAASNGVLYGEDNGLYAWSAENGHLLWHNPQLTISASSSELTALPVVFAAGKMYGFQTTQSANGNGSASNQIEVVDTSTGNLLHTMTINTPDPQPLGFAVSGNMLYVAMNSGSSPASLQAYSLSDDHLLWRKTYNGRILTLSSTDGQAYIGVRVLKVSKPVNKNPADYVANLIALNGDGSELWRWSDPAGMGMVAAIEVNGVVCVVDGGVVGVNASNGHKLWQTSFSLATGFPPVVD